MHGPPTIYGAMETGDIRLSSLASCGAVINNS